MIDTETLELHLYVNKEEVTILNEELENYFSNTIIPQLFVDADMVLRKFTPPAMKQFSLSLADVGRHIKDVQDNIRYPTLIENITEVISTGTILEKEVQTTDKRWFQMNILPYVERKINRTNGVIITFVDITARLATLKELEKLNADHSTLMFALSHDIRQPLSTIILVTDELTSAYDENDTEQFNNWVGTLKRASATMKELVNDFTEHIRMRDEKPAVDERLNIGNIFDDVLLALREEIYSTKAQISSRFDVGEIIFPRKNLRSIVYNLLSNAIKYRKTDIPLQIDIATSKENNHVVLSIADNGRGIDVKDQRTIFEKYTRIDREIEGTGMGLYIVSRMLEARGDRIEVQSELGKGSTFKVYLNTDS
ncbi:MAG: ATP-binding protein [Bacteroidota bacterium]|nr:ATP-binding protein [Bacteroidota bacterium]